MPNIALVGEAWGEREERERAAFVGPTGWLLNEILREAGIVRADCLITNVFNLRPERNKIEALCGPKKESLQGYPPLLSRAEFRGTYIRAEFEPELRRLGDELIEANPNLVVALGNTASWALLGKTSISKTRGNTELSTHTVSGFKVLPTYHPAAIFKQYQLRPLVTIDLVKAKRESEYPDVRRPKRQIWVEPSLEDMEEFYEQYIRDCEILSIDIETAGNQVRCIGFAPSERLSLVVPFIDQRRADRSYWRSFEAECRAWAFVRRVLEGSEAKVFQNGLYDIAFLWRSYKIRTVNAMHDTMLLHHALQPESLKGLGFLGSVYTDEGNWKQMRVRSTIKRDD